jgi:hypothetical protein
MKTKNSLVLLILAACALIIYTISIYNAYPLFQQTRLTDSLAELHSLSPLYYVAITLTALLILGCIIWRINNKYLHILLLMILANMLWLTPYWLTGFVRLPDAPWHVGVAMQIPQVLSGNTNAFSTYAVGFPGSFIYHFSLVNILGIQPLTYIYFFPLMATFIFILLCYVLLAGLFSTRVAVLALLLAIPGLHYLQLHASPHVIGALLMMTSLLLLVRPGMLVKIIAILVIILIIFSHPTTPLLLAIFLAAALFTFIIFHRRRISRTQMGLTIILVVVLVGGLSFYFYTQHLHSSNASFSFFSLLKGKLLPENLDTSHEFIAGSPFIFSSIYNLNKGVYIFYAIAAILLVLYAVIRTYLKSKRFRHLLSAMLGLQRTEVVMVISAPLLFILTVLLAERAHDLIETGLTYIILVLSCIIASIILRLRLNSRIIPPVLIAAVLFSIYSFPIVAYSIDAWSNFPRSERAGLEFLAETPLKGKIVGGGAFLPQIALFALDDTDNTKKTKIIRLDLGEVKPDVAVFRNTDYYYRAMRFDLSFEDNGYTRSLVEVQNLKYNKIYDSPTFQIYLKQKKQ